MSLSAARALCLVVTLGIVSAAGSAAVALPAAGAAASDAATCAAMSAPVSQRLNPLSKGQILTTSPAAAQAAAAVYTQDKGVVFAAGAASAPGLVTIRTLKNPRNNNIVYIKAGAEATGAVTKYRFVDQGAAFYASDSSLSCTVPVYRLRSASFHRQVVAPAERAALISAGWVDEGISFYVSAKPPAPTPTDTKFSIAVIPDTQQEVFGAASFSGTKFLNRSQYLVANAGPSALDLKFVTHTGDVVNWDTDNHSQYVEAANAMAPLTAARIPWSLSNGNHDNMATGSGGSARDSKNTRTLFRDTTTFNHYFTAAKYGAVSGAFEVNKVDNIYSEFTGGGEKWMVINLEMWPRPAAVDWAKQVVAAHPTTNVIVATHSYLDANGNISQSSGYGATSPQYLWDNLISQYSNIKLVFSGHTGIAASRTDVGVNGNTVHSFLAAIHSSKTNPVRIVEINTAADTLTSRIIAPYDNATTWVKYDKTITGFTTVK